MCYDMQRIKQVKELLKEEETVQELYINGDVKNLGKSLIILPILHNKDMIILQLHGWSINLYDDGTWIWEATDGG